MDNARRPPPSDDRFGPRVVDGAVRFSVWAPGARSVALVLDTDARERRVSMEREAEDFFGIAIEGAGPGTRYRFARDDAAPLPDPASRWQPEGVFRASEVVDLDGGAQRRPFAGVAVEALVVYELHVGTFSATRDYAGVERRLDHLRDLGITAIELMPLATCPGRRNWGYDGVYPFAPQPHYGSPQQLQRLVQACHARGIAVIIDVVTNHFGPEGNAMWTLAPGFFRREGASAWGSGIDWDQQPVLRFFDELARFWLRDYDVDGIRFDAFHAIPARSRALHLGRMLAAMAEVRPSERPTLALLESHANESALLGARDRIFVTQLNFDFQRATHALVSGETHGEYSDYQQAGSELARCLERGFCYCDRYSGHYRSVIGDASRPLPWAAFVNFIQNHDTAGNRLRGERLDLLADPAAVSAATALLLLHPAIPFLFMGQEWGSTRPFYFFTDHPPALGRRVARGRLRLFREHPAPRYGPHAPEPQAEQAMLGSSIDWDERERPPHAGRLELVRQVLAVRRRWRPEMAATSASARVVRDGRTFLLWLQARDPGAPPFLLVANFSETAHPCPASTVLYSSTPVADDDAIPANTTQLRRVLAGEASPGRPDIGGH